MRMTKIYVKNKSRQAFSFVNITYKGIVIKVEIGKQINQSVQKARREIQVGKAFNT